MSRWRSPWKEWGVGPIAGKTFNKEQKANTGKTKQVGDWDTGIDNTVHVSPAYKHINIWDEVAGVSCISSPWWWGTAGNVMSDRCNEY